MHTHTYILVLVACATSLAKELPETAGPTTRKQQYKSTRPLKNTCFIIIQRSTGHVQVKKSHMVHFVCMFFYYYFLQYNYITMCNGPIKCRSEPQLGEACSIWMHPSHQHRIPSASHSSCLRLNSSRSQTHTPPHIKSTTHSHQYL